MPQASTIFLFFVHILPHLHALKKVYLRTAVSLIPLAVDWGDTFLSEHYCIPALALRINSYTVYGLQLSAGRLSYTMFSDIWHTVSVNASLREGLSKAVY